MIAGLFERIIRNLHALDDARSVNSERFASEGERMTLSSTFHPLFLLN